jgi:hypothetical protein
MLLQEHIVDFIFGEVDLSVQTAEMFLQEHCGKLRWNDSGADLSAN